MRRRGGPWIDVEFAAMGGYLISIDGRLRQIPGLERIAEDTLRLRVAVRWGLPRDGRLACAYLDRPEIVLSPLLFEYDEGYPVKRGWGHELGHIMQGCNSDAAADWWFRRAYLSVAMPAWL